MNISRRGFLQTTAAVSAAAILPSFLSAEVLGKQYGVVAVHGNYQASPGEIIRIDGEIFTMPKWTTAYEVMSTTGEQRALSAEDYFTLRRMFSDDPSEVVHDLGVAKMRVVCEMEETENAVQHWGIALVEHDDTSGEVLTSSMFPSARLLDQGEKLKVDFETNAWTEIG